VKNNFYQLPDPDKGERYLKQMHDYINNMQDSHQKGWDLLSDKLLSTLPEYNSLNQSFPGMDTSIPSQAQWSDNHIESGWIEVDQNCFKVIDEKTKKYIYHEYTSFIGQFKQLLTARNNLAKFNLLRYRPLRRKQGNTTLLSQEGIKYTEALFILLGLDTDILDNHSAWFKFTMLGYDHPIGDEMFKDWLITHTSEAKLLNRNPDLQKSLLPTQDFINWAVSHKLLINLGSRVLPNKDELILFGGLIERGLIKSDSEINKIWQWNGLDNQRTYLAKQLKIKAKLFGENCHKELAAYLGTNTKSISANLSDPKLRYLRRSIDEIIKTLINKG
jgi:hypothetical protein